MSEDTPNSREDKQNPANTKTYKFHPENFIEEAMISDVFPDCKKCRTWDEEYGEWPDDFYEHFMWHTEKLWRAIGKDGRKKWEDYAKDVLDTYSDAYSVFSMAVDNAITRGVPPPLEPQKAFDDFLLVPEWFHPGSGKPHRAKLAECKELWRKLPKKSKILWHEFSRRLYIHREIYYLTPEEMDSIKIMPHSKDGYKQFEFAYNYVQDPRILSNPEATIPLMTDVYDTITFYIPGFWELEKINDNSWAKKYQRDSGIKEPGNVAQYKNHLQMLENCQNEVAFLKESMKETDDKLARLIEERKHIKKRLLFAEKQMKRTSGREQEVFKEDARGFTWNLMEVQQEIDQRREEKLDIKYQIKVNEKDITAISKWLAAYKHLYQKYL